MEQKVNILMLSVVAIIAIVFIVLLAQRNAYVTYQNDLYQDIQSSETTGDNLAGYVTAVASVESQAAQDQGICKLIVGQTTIYDTTTLAASLDVGGSTYYSGYSVSVTGINSHGCTISIGENTDYIAVGQIQQIGSVYVTVKEVLL